ncbi:LysR family transcriptional regulator [uncultured Aquitalea sp.]|uniref:LysR family transcriptional regulator n=1 Tax=uncultured Aquitalea sp. TaxID=540272 RepID=UPI0025F4F607|nr:LysR family transcriptional regulator [uncultured Aquitalea sp.]
MALRISLRELEVFVAIADHGTVTAAADGIGLTQSAASQALASLEGGLSATVFDRVGRKLLLNEQGRLLLPRARAMLDSAQEMQQMFTGDAGMHLRLGASTTIGNYLLPARLADFRLRHPAAVVELMVANTADVVDAVATFRVDAGFIEGPCHHPELVVEPWRQDRMCVFAAAGHPLAKGEATLAQLGGAEWVLREAGSGTREEVERLLLPHLGSLGQVMELGQSEAIKQLVAAGMGISCLSAHVVAEWLADGRLVELRSPLPTLYRTLFRVRHKDKVMGRGMVRFAEDNPPDEPVG